MNQDEIKQLLTLMENAEKGDEKEFEALEAFLDSKGLSYEDALQYQGASVENKPDTPVEERRQQQGKAVDDKKATRDALPLDSIAKAFGVDLKFAQEDGELDLGELEGYLQGRGVNFRVEGESNDEYRNRMLNAFESLGLNFNNADDRALVRNSIAHYGLMDKRDAIKEEAGSGVSGFITSMIAPRAFEKAQRDIMNGEGGATWTDFVGDSAKELALDLGENLAMTLGAPATAPVGAVKGAIKGTKAYKNFKKGKKVLDGRTNANKALKGVESIAGVTADAAAVPYAFEGLDAVLIDDPESSRAEFDNGDALASTGVNAVAPRFLSRGAGRIRAMLGDNAGTIGNAAENIVKVLPDTKGLQKYLEPYVVNKAGKNEMVRQLPVISSAAEEVGKKNEKLEKKSVSNAEKYDKWSRGLAIPMPGDKDFEEFQKWLEKNRYGLAKYR